MDSFLANIYNFVIIIVVTVRDTMNFYYCLLFFQISYENLVNMKV